MESIILLTLIFLGISSLIFLITFASNVFLSLGLYAHLKKQNYEKWKNLTSVMGVEGGSNPFKWLPYLSRIDDDDDDHTRKVKNKYKSFNVYVFSSFIAIILTIVLLLVLIQFKAS